MTLAGGAAHDARGASERRLLLDALARARAQGARLVSLSLACAAAPAEALLGLDGDAFVWQAPDGVELGGVGIAASFRGDGAARFREVRDHGSLALGQVLSLGDPAAPAPRLLGGFAFAPGSAARAPWRGFGDARFLLPRVRLARAGGAAWLTLSTTPEEIQTGVDALSRELAGLLAFIADAARTATPRASPRTVRRSEEEPESEWHRRVDAIRAAIAAGSLEKVVAARRLSVELDAPADARAVLERLRHDAPTSTRFAARFGPACFVGASPERLVTRAGGTVTTEAVAGTIRADLQAARALLGSAKDLGEHAIVVREIAARLAPLSARLQVPPAPEVRALRHVLHLATPIRAELREPVHVLDLAEHLHPTPAVGGAPRERAVGWIVEHEPDPRGWYAAPLGWFDAEGDGELLVALRSGLLEGTRAHLWAGSGIVAGSDPTAELAETRLKLAPLLGALALAPRADPTRRAERC